MDDKQVESRLVLRLKKSTWWYEAHECACVCICLYIYACVCVAAQWVGESSLTQVQQRSTMMW